ncbi:ABC transporter permease [Mesorhizobium sp. GR13]|uniref:ABC transporter permease n=1 Tax=Mesorhizobium sp. GR13 TaxID=2562308 RepID=UPI001980BB90|nr:ABC transporter permease [Mesorhizobium sp. GR13]
MSMERARLGSRACVPVLILPAWAFLIWFFLAPVGLIVWYSFGYKPDVFTSHDNSILSFDRYYEVLTGPLINSFLSSLRIAVLGTAIALVIAFPFAYWLATRVSTRWRLIFLAAVMIPFWTNFLVRTLGLQILLSGSGPISKALLQAQMISSPLNVLGSSTAVQVGVVYNYLPLMILPIFLSLDQISKNLREASNDLGANAFHTMRQVTIPLAFPGIVSGMLLVFIPLMGDYITASVLGGVKGTMVGQLVAADFLQAQNWARGSAAAIILILIILSTIAIAGAAAILTIRVIRLARLRL